MSGEGPLLLHELLIESIIFDLTSSVRVKCMFPDYNIGGWYPADIVCKINLLTDVLLLAGPEGEKIIFSFSERVNARGKYVPEILDVKKLFGKRVHVRGLVVQLRPLANTIDEEKDVHEDAPSFKIEAVQSLQDFKLNGLKTPVPSRLSPEGELQDIYDRLETSYLQYLNMLENGLDGKQARRNTMLTEETLFDIARLRYKIKKGRRGGQA